VEGYSFSFHAVNSSKETSLLLPVGISFYTFQTLSYSIDVYRDKYAPERHLGKFALFVSFFPQLIAGPIERANKLLPQFKAKHLKFKLGGLRDGLLLFVWGLFKKIVIADNLRVLVDHVFNNQEFQSGGEIIFALFAFSFQIYADFSGYSDMAIGLAKMLGIDLSVNFKTPYFSQSVTQFWRRWHITLSTWLKDYVYVPLKGNRATSILTFRNVMITFILAGLWHGASWGFVIWGTIHGVFVISERMLGVRYDSSNRIVKLARTTVTFLFVMLAWLPFRAEGVDQLIHLSSQLIEFSYGSLYLAFAENIFTPGVFGIVFLLCTDFIFGKSGVLKLNELNWRIRYVWVALICILIFFLGDTQSGEFLYFQF
jgi:D-alanyl-lipoteichoic acid acyltransferase DltB (MBOAT superfamily)